MKANAIKRSSYKVEKIEIINKENFFFLNKKNMKVCPNISQ